MSLAVTGLSYISTKLQKVATNIQLNKFLFLNIRQVPSFQEFFAMHQGH